MIRSLFEQKIQFLSEKLDQYPFEDLQSAYRYLGQQYYLIQNTTRYEAIAASLLPLEAKEEFRQRILHLTEEFNHDSLIIDDLKELGFNQIEKIYPATRALIACIYNELREKGPDSLFGIALLLEGLSVRQCDQIGRRLFKVFDYYPKYLEVHHQADDHHYPEMMTLIESFPQERQNIIISNLELSFYLYNSIVDQCLQPAMGGPKIRMTA